MYIYFDAEGSQGIPDTVSHFKYKSSIRRCMRQIQNSILYGLDTGATFTFLLSQYVSIVKYQLIFRYRVWTKRNEESLWFGLRLFPAKWWGQYLYPIANKITQRNNSCFIWTHSEIPFASMKRTLSIRLSRGTKMNCIAVPSRWSHYL
jgi:hypothetical protein